MENLRKDAKDLLIGNDGSEKEPDDFSVELKRKIKDGSFTEEKGKVLITARENVDKKAEALDKRQNDDAKKINAGKVYESAEEEKEDIRKKEKKEEERKRREREAKSANEMSKAQKKQNNIQKEKIQKEVQREKEKIE